MEIKCKTCTGRAFPPCWCSWWPGSGCRGRCQHPLSACQCQSALHSPQETHQVYWPSSLNLLEKIMPMNTRFIHNQLEYQIFQSFSCQNWSWWSQVWGRRLPRQCPPAEQWELRDPTLGGSTLHTDQSGTQIIHCSGSGVLLTTFLLSTLLNRLNSFYVWDDTSSRKCQTTVKKWLRRLLFIHVDHRCRLWLSCKRH